LSPDKIRFFKVCLATPLTVESVGIFSHSISTVTKVAVMTCSSSIKPLALFQELFSMGEALLREQQMAD
jgi:hypothetical protein